ncbi:type IA DNA topoisomerase [Alkalitalea saponilacus]|uniref:DNA topoisomerase n=1 Tax=Alkalitalea saponilacus TaxID=889453 RepID=A0A1T5DIB3_9BACT|nr:type IA DNA topoisomerase [Alkalitalea saponilacus]ASB50706.1 DNA topoisomerase III [Alkalitalea saponilacus]SKB71454.1 DNA topoisomerase-3 [Alkalitalea saponilacus]
MKVCIAEKPSVAKELARILGATSRKDGYFEGNGYQVTWTFGHLCTLKEPHDYLPDWKRWSLGTLPIIPSRFGIKLLNDQGVIKQFKAIEQLVKNAEMVINCGDAGQEGEVIQRWVLQKAECKCPVKRLWISSLTEEAIREGFEKLHAGEQFDALYAAGSARAIGDWLLGINATRLYTLKYGQQGQVLSIGRVQTPTLALIVERQKEIDNFTPQPYWELKTVYKEVTFNNSEGRFTNKDEAEKAIETIRGKEFEITGFGRKKGKESPPRLFDLTSLQVECNRKFGLSADETLKTIQLLYEKKLTTYPRVDTTFLSNDMYPKIGGILKGLKPYEALTTPLLEKKIPKSKKVFDDNKVTDHHAIIPTGQNPSSSLSRDEKLVFDMVTRRFIAAFYPDAVINTTTVEGKVETVNFKATGKQIIEPGWRVVLKQAGSGKSDDSILPEFTKGEKGPHEPDLQEKETQPPKPFTEATLLRAMETAGKQVDDEELRDVMKENGIGRPSTRAAIIETLFKRKYIIKNRKSLAPTITGMQLIDTIRNESVKSAELTGQWEKKLRDIEHGKYDAGEFMNELKQMVSDIVHTVRREPTINRIEVVQEEDGRNSRKETATDEKSDDGKCPRCGEGTMLKGKQAWGCSRYKEGCQTVVPFVFMGKQLTPNQMETLFKKGKTPLIKGFDVNGEKVDGILTLDENYQLQLDKDEAPEWKCPKCKEGLIIKGRSAYGCNRYSNGCKVLVPFELMGKKLTEKQVQDLVLRGKTNQLKGFTDANGNPKEGKLTWNDDFQVVLEA